MNDTRTVYEALETVAEAVQPIRARKNLVLFSAGIADIHETIRGGMLVGRSPEVDDMLEALNGANVAVYAVQIQRQVPSDPVFHQRLTEISASTGGRYFQFNTSFETVLNEIENTNSGYYLVTYRSPHPRGEQGFQRVQVKVRNPEFRVVARSGYEYGS
jgi:VWFA-related protein